MKKTSATQSKKATTGKSAFPADQLSAISLDDAQQQILKWRSNPVDPDGFHGFLISAKDVLGIANVILEHMMGGKTILGVRAYLGIESDGKPFAGSPSLMLVAVEQDTVGGDGRPVNLYGRDIYDRQDPKRIEGSGIFNFTSPCPPCCEPESALVNIPGAKKNLSLKTLGTAKTTAKAKPGKSR